MDKNEILAEVQEVFRDVLENDDIVLTPETTANDVEDWDSLSHIQLIVAIEKKLKTKFTSKEILSWSNISEMVDCISSK